jgi:hypothetical protein
LAKNCEPSRLHHDFASVSACMLAKAPSAISRRPELSSRNHPNSRPAKPAKVNSWGIHGGQYGWRLNAAFDSISSPAYPEGMIPWLEIAAPHLHDRMTRAPPDHLSQACGVRPPFDEFSAWYWSLKNCTHGRFALPQHLSGLPEVREVAGSLWPTWHKSRRRKKPAPGGLV